MEYLKFDLSQQGKAFKILNATNGGPIHKRHANDQFRDNLEAYRAARIPYARNHDANLIYQYGGPHVHDINAIFPNFDADENDPASYDFACTDENILVTLEAGTETFFRLGQTIEHQIKKYYTIPPKDFTKWARVCEHIIRHYNEGWANGFQLNIQYWEIWNEPDLDADDAPNKRMWGGTKADFFDMYAIAAKHLKAAFPHLKIGGPALAHNESYAKDFLEEMQKREVPIDFFSWHIYCTDPNLLEQKAARIHKLLDTYGYGNAESILNEWNYVKGWEEDYVPSILTVHGMKGAAFIMACYCVAQQAQIDMLMYYDTRLSVLNGVFDFYTLMPLKGYYSFLWYGMFYDMQAEIPCSTHADDIYTLCGKAKDGKTMTVVAYYTEHEQDAPDKGITVNFGKEKFGVKYEFYLLDETHDGELIKVSDETVLTLKPNTCVLMREAD